MVGRVHFSSCWVVTHSNAFKVDHDVNMLIVHLGEHTVVEVTMLTSPMLAIYVQAIALRQHKMSYMLCRILYHLIWIGCQERITYAVVCVKLKTVPKCTLTHG